MTSFIYTTITGNNADLIKDVGELYFKDGFIICDPTFGKGVFWRKIDLTRFEFFPSDLLTCPDHQYDFRHLPYAEDSFNVLVFDPPYCHNPGCLIVDANYKNAATTKGFYHRDIIQLYREGMIEAARVLQPGGLLLVKCKDEIESSKQRRSHIELYSLALDELRFTDEALFILKQKNNPIVQHKRQLHPRKNCSYLWVFRKNEKTKR